MARIFGVAIQDKGVKAALQSIANGDMTGVWQEVGRAIKTQVNIGFIGSKDPFGYPWKPLKFRNGQPLRDTKLLQNSIYARPDAKGVTVGTNVKYARVHQFGMTIYAKPGQPGTNSIGPRKGAPFMVFRAGGSSAGASGKGALIFAKKVTIPARRFLPVSPGGKVVLPPKWQAAVQRGLRAHFTALAKGKKPKAGYTT